MLKKLIEILKNCFSILILPALIGCSHSPSKSTKSIDVNIPDSVKVHFSGKGAGAGMMLMSSMGPMGIAVGIAIDVGIAKAIQSSLEGHVGNIQSFLKQNVEKYCAGNAAIPRQLEFRRIEFKMVPGSDAEQAAVFIDLDNLGVPINLGSGESLKRSFPLDELKNNGSVAADALVQELIRLCEFSRP